MSETSLVSRANFVATGAGTGYSSGDYIDHVVVVDISSGAVIAKFWENLTTEAKLASAPSPSNLGRMPVLINVDTITIAEPAGLATSAKQDAASASLASLDEKMPALSGGKVPVDGSGVTQPVSAESLPLPSGAATDANLDTVAGDAGTAAPSLAASASGIIGWLRKLVDTLAGGIGVTGTFWQETQPISAASLPLPDSASTADNQTTANTSLTSIDGKLSSALTVGGMHAVAAASFDRPADTTAYAIGDLIADSTTALSVTPLAISVARVNGGTGTIRRGRLTKSDVSTTLASFRAHLYKTAPTPANGDNGALSTDQALSYIGSMNFDMTGSSAHVFTDGVNCISTPNVGSDITFAADSGVQTIYALLEARAAYAPASGETFTLALEVLRD